MLIKKIAFCHYKAFLNFSVQLSDFDVLVGPNNSGKSTVIGACRILAEGIRRANAKKPELIMGPNGVAKGYRLNLREIPVSLENVFYNYEESQPATIHFYLENNYELILFFPERGSCIMFPQGSHLIDAPAAFRKDFPIRIGVVPILGPVEHEEELYQEEAARKALLTHRASRNFRNIWYHYPEGFDEFREMIISTWPGMDIKPPEIIRDEQLNGHLAMFCPEENWPREIYWAGFGFQVWCQMLTYILKAKDATMLIIDEPDIYLHSDLQRQLVHILHDLGPQIIIATHSIEIISEVEAGSLLTIHKKRTTATRIRNYKKIQEMYRVLGSNANPVLTQLAKTRRVVFLEGKDYQILSLFAKKLGCRNVANRSDFAIVPADGFNPIKVKDFAQGMEMTLGMPLLRCVIFDRDYRCAEEVDSIISDLKESCGIVFIHKRKEIENFLLSPLVLDRAISKAIEKKGGAENTKRRSASEILNGIAETWRVEILTQYLARHRSFIKQKTPRADDATIDSKELKRFEEEWATDDGKLRLLPGKEALSRLNTVLQQECGVALTVHMIIDSFYRSDIDIEMEELITTLSGFGKMDPPDSDESLET